MQNDQPSLFARDDTFFGVCQGLGEDFGFNPVWLRLSLPVLLFFFPIATLAAYAGAGVVVFATRWIYPEPRLTADAEAPAAPEPAEAEQDWVRLAARGHAAATGPIWRGSAARHEISTAFTRANAA